MSRAHKPRLISKWTSVKSVQFKFHNVSFLKPNALKILFSLKFSLTSADREMSSPSHSPPANANYRKRSLARSFSSELGTVDEGLDEENCESCHTKNDPSDMNGNSVVDPWLGDQSTQQEAISPLANSAGSAVERIHTTPCPREVMKTKIRYHYMNPFQKFRARRRKPWKLVLQIVKIVLVTLQVIYYD